MEASIALKQFATSLFWASDLGEEEDWLVWFGAKTAMTEKAFTKEYKRDYSVVQDAMEKIGKGLSASLQPTVPSEASKGKEVATENTAASKKAGETINRNIPAAGKKQRPPLVMLIMDNIIEGTVDTATKPFHVDVLVPGEITEATQPENMQQVKSILWEYPLLTLLKRNKEKMKKKKVVKKMTPKIIPTSEEKTKIAIDCH